MIEAPCGMVGVPFKDLHHPYSAILKSGSLGFDDEHSLPFASYRGPSNIPEQFESDRSMYTTLKRSLINPEGLFSIDVRTPVRLMKKYLIKLFSHATY